MNLQDSWWTYLEFSWKYFRVTVRQSERVSVQAGERAREVRETGMRHCETKEILANQRENRNVPDRVATRTEPVSS